MNHAVGLSRGIKCGDNYNCIEEIVDKIKDPKALKPKTPEPVSETSYQHVEGKSTTNTIVDEAKQSKNNSKNNSKNIHSY